MLVQSTLSQSHHHHHQQHHHQQNHVFLSSTFSHYRPFPTGFPNSTFLPSIATHHRTTSPVIKCGSKPNVNGYGRGNHKTRPTPTWKIIYKRISRMENPEMGPTGVLEEWEKEGHVLTRWEIRRFVKELRKFGRNKPALEAFEWMTNRRDRFSISSGDMAIQLDLVARVHGISGAEDYFLKMPDSLKDERVYGALLNAYVTAKMKEKAESLIARMKERGYTKYALPFNVMMTLYMKLKHYDKVEAVISEMMEKKIPLDIYSYHIWLSSCGSDGSAERMEEVFEQMKFDKSINPNWSTFSTMASVYIKLGHLEKAYDCLKKVEGRMQGLDRSPYHYLITHYSNAGNRGEVQRIWNNYRTIFPFIPNMSYLAAISSFLRLDDIEEAEKIYEEWLNAKTNYEPRIGNLMLGWYVAKGEEEKAEAFFSQMGEVGRKRNSRTWEIMAEVRVKERRVSEAVDYLAKGVVAEGSEYWNINPMNATTILNLCEQEGDTASMEILLGVLRQAGCFEDEAYRSYMSNTLPSGNELPIIKGRISEDLDEVIANQLQASL